MIFNTKRKKKAFFLISLTTRHTKFENTKKKTQKPMCIVFHKFVIKNVLKFIQQINNIKKKPLLTKHRSSAINYYKKNLLVPQLNSKHGQSTQRYSNIKFF